MGVDVQTPNSRERSRSAVLNVLSKVCLAELKCQLTTRSFGDIRGADRRERLEVTSRACGKHERTLASVDLSNIKVRGRPINISAEAVSAG